MQITQTNSSATPPHRPIDLITQLGELFRKTQKEALPTILKLAAMQKYMNKLANTPTSERNKGIALASTIKTRKKYGDLYKTKEQEIKEFKKVRDEFIGLKKGINSTLRYHQEIRDLSGIASASLIVINGLALASLGTLAAFSCANALVILATVLTIGTFIHAYSKVSEWEEVCQNYDHQIATIRFNQEEIIKKTDTRF